MKTMLLAAVAALALGTAAQAAPMTSLDTPVAGDESSLVTAGKKFHFHFGYVYPYYYYPYYNVCYFKPWKCY
jgi:hypothetical protein